MKSPKLKTAVLMNIVIAFHIHAQSPDEAFVRSVSIIESGGHVDAVGDSGKAIGPFQFWEIAWRDVSENYRKPRGLSVWPYSKAKNAEASKVYAANFFDLQRIRFRSATGREPTLRDLYALFNLGFQGYKRRGFDLSRCPKITQQAAERVVAVRAEILKAEGR